MKRKQLFQLIAVYMIVMSSQATRIIHECMRKLNVLAGTAHIDGIAFDWGEEVRRDFNT